MNPYSYKPVPNVILCVGEFLIFAALLKLLYPVDWRPAVFALIAGIFFGLLESKALDACATELASARSMKEARQILAKSRLSKALFLLLAVPAAGLGAWFGGSSMNTAAMVWMIGCWVAFFFARDLVSMHAVFRLARLKGIATEQE